MNEQKKIWNNHNIQIANGRLQINKKVHSQFYFANNCNLYISNIGFKNYKFYPLLTI